MDTKCQCLASLILRESLRETFCVDDEAADTHAHAITPSVWPPQHQRLHSTQLYTAQLAGAVEKPAHLTTLTRIPPHARAQMTQYFCFVCSQKETQSDHQLHLAALQGNVQQLITVLDSGKVHVDCKDKVRHQGAGYGQGACGL